MATRKYDVLKKRDMTVVKKDIKDIKKKLVGKTLVSNKKSMKLIPHEDVTDVKRDIKEIKNTLNKKVVVKKAPAKTTKFDNYYDLMPHKKLEKLEEEVIILKEKLKTKNAKKKARKAPARKALSAPAAAPEKDSKSIEKSMNKLSRSINNLMRLFEIAEKQPAAASGSSESMNISETLMQSSESTTHLSSESNEELISTLRELRDKISELSMENEEMAKGILVIAEMLKESLPEGKSQEIENNVANSYDKRDAFAAFNSPMHDKEGDMPPLPPLESLPDAPYPQDPTLNAPQEKKRNFY